MAKRANNDKLRLWQDRLSRNESAYESEASRMDEREALYAGVNQLRAIVRGERKTQTPHVRNICAELIEAQTDSNIPQPKVTARRKKDEMKAKLIEDMLRNELDRMPFEQQGHPSICSRQKSDTPLPSMLHTGEHCHPRQKRCPGR